MMNSPWDSEVSVYQEDLWRKNHRFQNEPARLRSEINAIKSQIQGKENKYLEDIEMAQEETDNLQRTVTLNEERIFWHNGQLNSLTVVYTMPNSELEHEKQIKESLGTETESHGSRVAAAVQGYDERQASKRDVELAFQRAREEGPHLQDKLNFDRSKLKDASEMLSHQLSQAERKVNSLEIEFHRARDALREKTSAGEQVHSEQKQTLCQMKEIKRMYQDAQREVKKCMQKQESLEERLSQFQHENALLRKQLDDAHKRIYDKEKTAINIHDKFQEELKKQYSMLEDINDELIKENNHLRERLSQCEKEKADKGTQATPQENLEQLSETNNASMINQMELRIKTLESEVSKMKIQEKSTKEQLEKYKQLYLE